MAEQLLGDRYRLVRKVLRGNTSRGIPELWEAHDSGDVYYAKIWRRPKGAHADIQALWNREVRSLSRLQGYPGAGQLFARLHDLDANENAFFAILDGGRRSLLSEVLGQRSSHDWLINLGEVGRRRNLWEGLLRIAEAIVVLHRDGTLHRSITTSSIFVGPNGGSDFRLSGFEWSLRVAGRDGAASEIARSTKHPRAPELDKEEGEYSTATDWFDFGLVAAEIFGAQVQGTKKRAEIRASVGRLGTLNDAERFILNGLIAEDMDNRLIEGDEIVQDLTNLVRTMGRPLAGSGRSLIVAVRASAGGDLTRSIMAASKHSIPPDDPMAICDWVRLDLAGDIKVISRLKPYPHYVLKGKRLEYRAKQWSMNGLQTWDIAFCEQVEQKPKSLPDDEVFSIGDRRLDVITFSRAVKKRLSLRDRSISWDRAFPFRENRTILSPELADVHDFFRVTQQITTILTAAEICPVRVLENIVGSVETVVSVTPTEDSRRNNVAQALGIPNPSEQLRDWFEFGIEEIDSEEDGGPTTDRYYLLEKAKLTGEDDRTQWQFLSATSTANGPIYRFKYPGVRNIATSRLFLAKNHDGTIKQLRRQHKAINDLVAHEGLLRFLSNPQNALRIRRDRIPTQNSQISLDPSKQDALRRLWSTEPAFMVQGPPGTGKTTLIKAFVDVLFKEDPSAQVLISAHSHHTVDDVRVKIAELFEYSISNKPILLRLGGNRETKHDVDAVTQSIIENIQRSKLFDRSPEHLQARFLDCASVTKEIRENEDADLHAMEILCQDAANITFTTLNAGPLAELNERGRRFDWSVIEEAGKAHGFDMAVALQESHRIILIGDHFQLSPFNARVLKDLLAEPLRVKVAIQQGAAFAAGLVDPSLVEDTEEREPFVDRCSRWREMVNVFEYLFEQDSSSSPETSSTWTLTDQHRMHPDIAELVGRTFYRSEQGGTILRTPEEVKLRFRKQAPFIIQSGSELDGYPIIWCDVPWVQKQRWAEGEADGLFVSRSETDVLARVLEQIYPKGNNKCELQILSPYNDQLDAIRNKIADMSNNNEIQHMFTEPFNLLHRSRMGATVDQFQGSEADIVIVSLVRNNGLPPAKSLGFLKEANRMNVLLSRARHKLVVIGSWDFFDSRCDQFTSEDDEHHYIGTMMSVMKYLQRDGRLKVVRAF
ncbi:MAG: AAA family ATPase [Rhodobacteraceae bacterium]|nr:AAA family ATPase [Paracoccaceae bacterium]